MVESLSPLLDLLRAGSHYNKSVTSATDNGKIDIRSVKPGRGWWGEARAKTFLTRGREIKEINIHISMTYKCHIEHE